MNKIFIKNLIIETSIGIYPTEHTNSQLLIFDLELYINNNNFYKTIEQDKNYSPSNNLSNYNYNNLNYTIDYEVLCNWLIKLVTENQSNNKTRLNLLETMAEFISNNIFQTFKPEKITLSITKPSAITHTKSVGIYIERHLKDF